MLLDNEGVGDLNLAPLVIASGTESDPSPLVSRKVCGTQLQCELGVLVGLVDQLLLFFLVIALGKEKKRKKKS